MIAAINSILGGVGLALLAARVASLATGAALAVGITAAVVLFGLQLLYQQQRATFLVLRGHRPRHHRPSSPWAVDRGDDVEDRLRGGGVLFVGNQIFVGGAVDDAVHAVG